MANLTEISGSKLDVKKTGVAIITTRLVEIMAESPVSNFGKGGKISESFFFFQFGPILKTPIQITYRISLYSFRTFMYCDLRPYVLHCDLWPYVL